MQEGYSLSHRRPSPLVFRDAGTGKTVSLRHMRLMKASCSNQGMNFQFGEDGNEWASLLLTPKICQVLQIDRLDTALCALC